MSGAPQMNYGPIHRQQKTLLLKCMEIRSDLNKVFSIDQRSVIFKMYLQFLNSNLQPSAMCCGQDIASSSMNIIMSKIISWCNHLLTKGNKNKRNQSFDI